MTSTPSPVPLQPVQRRGISDMAHRQLLRYCAASFTTTTSPPPAQQTRVVGRVRVSDAAGRRRRGRRRRGGDRLVAVVPVDAVVRHLHHARRPGAAGDREQPGAHAVGVRLSPAPVAVRGQHRRGQRQRARDRAADPPRRDQLTPTHPAGLGRPGRGLGRHAVIVVPQARRVRAGRCRLRLAAVSLVRSRTRRQRRTTRCNSRRCHHERQGRLSFPEWSDLQTAPELSSSGAVVVAAVRAATAPAAPTWDGGGRGRGRSSRRRVVQALMRCGCSGTSGPRNSETAPSMVRQVLLASSTRVPERLVVARALAVASLCRAHSAAAVFCAVAV